MSVKSWLLLFVLLTLFVSACGGDADDHSISSPTPCRPEGTVGQVARVDQPELRDRLQIAGVNADTIAAIGSRECPNDPVPIGQWFDLMVTVNDVTDDEQIGQVVTRVTLALAEWPDAQITINLQTPSEPRRYGMVMYQNRHALDLVSQGVGGAELLKQLENQE